MSARVSRGSKVSCPAAARVTVGAPRGALRAGQVEESDENRSGLILDDDHEEWPVSLEVLDDWQRADEPFSVTVTTKN